MNLNMTIPIRSAEEALSLAMLFESYSDSYPILSKGAEDLRALAARLVEDPAQLPLLPETTKG